MPALAVCAGLSSCTGGDGGAARFPQMEIEAIYPVTGAFQTVATLCSGAEATLVSFDVDSDREFEYRFLFDASGQLLYGCNGLCESGVIEGEIAVPRRVMIEGITVPPLEYGLRRHDVACRGIADRSNRMGAIVESPLQFPGFDDAVHVEVPMLRVGAFNGMFGTDNPVMPGMVASLLVPPEAREEVSGDLRVSTGGIVVAAGGFNFPDLDAALVDVWEFHPWSLSWERTATTGTGHSFGSAESFVDGAGNAGVLFVGGLGTNQVAVLTADAYHHGKAVTDSHAMKGPRVFSGAVRSRERGEPVIAVLGGCVGNTYANDFEYFFPVARPATCGGAQTPGFCTPSASIMVEGRCQAGVQLLAGDRVWFGTGMTSDGDLDAGAHLFDASADGDYGNPGADGIANVQVPVRLPGTALLHDEVVGVFGGILTPGPVNPFGVTDRWVAHHPTSGGMANGVMREPRGYPTANRLLDGRVLVAGGQADGGVPLDSAELFERGNAESGGQFENIAPPGHTSCVSGVDCERMSQARAAHVATTIVGSATWLEGAVLITGGSLGAFGTPEIFVPAYDCDGTKPVNRFDGERVPDVELCDRLREPPRITDPRKPKRF